MRRARTPAPMSDGDGKYHRPYKMQRPDRFRTVWVPDGTYALTWVGPGERKVYRDVAPRERGGFIGHPVKVPINAEFVKYDAGTGWHPVTEERIAGHPEK